MIDRLRAWYVVRAERLDAWETEAGYRLCEWMCDRFGWQDCTCRAEEMR
jgi:hypothetical protein